MRLKRVLLLARFEVSIHASVKDATFLFHLLFLIVVVSIHASVKDATAAYAKTLAETKFQSTHL